MKKSLYISLSILILYSCTKIEEQTAGSQKGSYPDQESWNSTLIVSNNGRKVGVVNAEHFKKYTNKRLTELSEGLTIDFYDNNGQHTSILFANGGEVYEHKQNMKAYGNVKVVSDSGLTLYTDTLIWNNEQQKIISEIPVMLTTETDTLWGDSFVSDPNLENYTITNARGHSLRNKDKK